MVRLGKRNYIFGVALLTLLAPSTMYAQTTTDLYDKLQVPEQTQYETTLQQISDATLDYNTKEAEYTYAVSYNNVLNNLDTDSIKAQLDDTLAHKDAVANEIASNGYYMSVTDVKSLYSQYKYLCDMADELQHKYDNYSSRIPMEIPDYDFDVMSNNIENLKSLASQQLEESEIGEVSEIVNFVQTPYCVKKAFDGNSVTLKTVEDTGVLSMFSGTVTYADKDETGIEMVTISSGDNISITYKNLKARYVQEGDVVKQYQKIATTKTDLCVILQIGDNYYDINKLYGGE